MLSFSEFFHLCYGVWQIERTYHYLDTGEIERSHTEYDVRSLPDSGRDFLLHCKTDLQFDVNILQAQPELLAGFAIAFKTISETGEQLSMELHALFVPDAHVLRGQTAYPLPPCAVMPSVPENITGYYLRNKGYSEAGIAIGRFCYQPTRQMLEMTTYYQKSIAVDQMRLVDHSTRLRNIITYSRPEQEITLIGFGVEQRLQHQENIKS